MSTIPFSFLYSGKAYTGETLIPSGERAQIPGSSVRVWQTRKSHGDANAIDQTLWLENVGEENSGVLSRVNAADISFPYTPLSGGALLHTLRGSEEHDEDWLPVTRELTKKPPESAYELSGLMGKPSGSVAPFFTLEWAGGGAVCAVGWSGQWRARIERMDGNILRLTVGMEDCKLYLKPNERIRLPRVLILPYRGSREEGENAFRRLMIDDVIPRVDGQIAFPPMAHMTTSLHEADRGTEEDVRAHFDAVGDCGFEALWLDAFFHKGGFPMGIGAMGFPVSRVVDEKRHPHGLKMLSDYAHARDAEFLVWFEPERVSDGSILMNEHPEWIVTRMGTGFEGGRFRNMFDLGDPAAREFMTEYLIESVEEFGIDILRFDFNYDPLPFWRKRDTMTEGENREGISEIRYVEGLYAMWDALLERFPRLRIDNCASGGMRIDLETCERSFVLWRSDAQIAYCNGQIRPADPAHVALMNQSMTLGLNRYLPFSLSAVFGCSPYLFRSGCNGGASFQDDCRADGYPLNDLRRAVSEGKRLRRFLLGDFYPITNDAGLSEEAWCVMQYALPDEGILLAFRRPKSDYEEMTLPLRWIDQSARYRLRISFDYENATEKALSGKELALLTLRIPNRPACALIEYKKL